jgi:hypothetical protein
MVSLFFPNKTLDKMAKIGIKESDIYDVFNGGEDGLTSDSTRVVVKKYNGYEIGCFYAKTTKVSFDYIIIAVWKRDRR